ncbi:hypothetical protein M758_8G155600 [Ceratodon purpureus]|uniref:Secreted protein n=1 Tax=Ceratodon purpureus TaxID=3225 RepID=A0A8T0H4H8_CERPU|nr:hypothetical protein KC19_8G159200 [Ceratodon purpureus]KAG0609076.1 hypothetical protein M758_8G155600 [Ceratodon purpureus]
MMVCLLLHLSWWYYSVCEQCCCAGKWLSVGGGRWPVGGCPPVPAMHEHDSLSLPPMLRFWLFVCSVVWVKQHDQQLMWMACEFRCLESKNQQESDDGSQLERIFDHGRGRFVQIR